VGELRNNKMKTPPNKIIWTAAEIEFLKTNYNTLTNAQLHEALGKNISQHSMRNKLYEMGLYKLELEFWTPEMVEYLLKIYKKTGDTEIANIFNDKFPKNKTWTKKHIEKKRRYLNLKRSQLQLKKIKERSRLDGAYSRGNIKMWQTRGANALGTVVKWSDNSMIKTANGYEFLARHNYEKKHGKIPTGGNIYHKDGDRANCQIDNLFLVMNTEQGFVNREPANKREHKLLIGRLKNLQGKEVIYNHKKAKVTKVKKMIDKYAIFINDSPKVIYENEIVDFMLQLKMV
jgi:HNH endonuclease